MADEKKKRSSNFSANDCLLLASIMGRGAQNFEMSNYKLIRHKFTNSITSATKKAAWGRISESYNSSCEVPRMELDITKKWDNLVQTHRTKYFDYLRDQGKTGGGPNTKVLSAITEAVMDVIGRFSENVVGVPSCGTNMDSTMVQKERIDQNTSSFPLYTEAAAEGSSDNIPIFRSYKPLDEKLQDSAIPKAKPSDVSDRIQTQIEAAKSESIIEEVDLMNLAPRKPDWDLKRDVAKKLEKLEKRTQKAIAELIRERLKTGNQDLAQVVNAGTMGNRQSENMDDDDDD